MVTCGTCGRDNPPDARFCNACGSSLHGDGAGREERKVVSVLFADLVGFTSRAERLDAEEVRAVLRPYHDGLRRELERHGGTVEKFIGDAVMAVFGAPVVHEDDPERAVRAGLAIRDAVADDGTLEVRIGITTGEALVAVDARPDAGEGMVAGDVVNTAARLQTAAPVNGVLVDEATFRATERTIVYREHEAIVARGKARPVPVHEAVEPRSRVGVELRRIDGAPLVGRDDELAALVSALDGARTREEPELVTIVGVPGIGKSRLVWELAQRVDAEEDYTTWRQGRSLPYGDGISFWALSEMVKAEAGILETDAPEVAERKLAAGLAALDVEDVEWLSRHLRPLVGLGSAASPGDGGRSEAFAAWRRFFEALAKRRATVLVFEDLHWADEGLLDFVDHLLDWVSGAPLLMVCTARPDLFTRRPHWGAGRANATTLSLSPLSSDESKRLVEALSDGAALPRVLVDVLVANAGGNPLYAEEFLRLAAETDLASAPLPETVHGIIAARLDTLPPAEKLVLQDAAVLGRAFWTGGVATVGSSARWSVEDVMHRLERKEFVHRRRPSSVASETEFAFRHALVRDVAYAQIPRSQRAAKHRTAAEWIESLSAERVEEKAEMLAHHYRAALEYATASRQDTSELAERARRALLEAGDRAAALNAWPAATRFYREALGLWPADDPRRGRVLFAYGKALFRAAGVGREELEEALATLVAADAAELAAEAEVMLGELAFRHGDRDGAFERFESALARVTAGPPSETKARVLSTLSRFHTVALEPSDAIRFGREALTLAEELGLDEIAAHAYNNIGFARVTDGDPGGVVDLERSVSMAVALKSPEAIRAYLNLGTCLAHLGDLSRSFEVHGAGRRAAERFGDAAGREWFAAERLWEAYWRGEWEKADELAEELLADVAAGSPRSHLEPSARLVRGWLGLARGALEEALEHTTILVEFARGARYMQMLFPALAMRAHVLVASERYDEAWAEARDLIRIWTDTGVNGFSYWTADLAFTLARLGRNDELLQPLALASPTRWTDAAQALAAREPLRAAAVYARIGSAPDEALARLLAADWLLARDRTDEARAQLDAALAFFRRVDAARYVAEAEALLAITV